MIGISDVWVSWLLDHWLQRFAELTFTLYNFIHRVVFYRKYSHRKIRRTSTYCRNANISGKKENNTHLKKEQSQSSASRPFGPRPAFLNPPIFPQLSEPRDKKHIYVTVLTTDEGLQLTPSPVQCLHFKRNRDGGRGLSLLAPNLQISCEDLGAFVIRGKWEVFL